eukprot:5502513-Amphidinium_carterae.1
MASDPVANELEESCLRQLARRLHDNGPLLRLPTEEVLRQVEETIKPHQMQHLAVRDLYNLAEDKRLRGHIGLHLKYIERGPDGGISDQTESTGGGQWPIVVSLSESLDTLAKR